MSQRGGNDKKRGPKFQNAFAFAHNRNSKKTKKIAEMANEGLCQHCWDKIEWRKKYRKYKPLTQPSTWYVYVASLQFCASPSLRFLWVYSQFCKQKCVTAAYHKACSKCAKKKKVCGMCVEKKEIIKSEKQMEDEQEAKYQELLAQPMKERERRTLVRKMEKAKAAGKLFNPDGSDDEEEEDYEDEEMVEGGEADMPTVADMDEEPKFHMPGEGEIKGIFSHGTR
jgi:hypothetical protein